MSWDAAKKAAGLGHRDRDIDLLRELVKTSGNAWEEEAFPDMLERLEHGGQGELTSAQREKVNESAERRGIEVEYQGADAYPRGREVELLVKDKPLKPPGRR